MWTEPTVILGQRTAGLFGNQWPRKMKAVAEVSLEREAKQFVRYFPTKMVAPKSEEWNAYQCYLFFPSEDFPVLFNSYKYFIAL